VWIAAAVAAVLVVIVLSIVVFYLVTRLRFAFFHCLIHNTSEIGPGWRLYRTQAARFFGLNLVVAFSYVLLFGLAMFPFMTGFIRVVRETPPGSQPDLWKFLPLILPLIPIILLIALIAFVLEVILRDFILPHYALEDATVRRSMARGVGADQGREKTVCRVRAAAPDFADLCNHRPVHRLPASRAYAGRFAGCGGIRNSLGLRGC
jgi:hypothetical protein